MDLKDYAVASWKKNHSHCGWYCFALSIKIVAKLYAVKVPGPVLAKGSQLARDMKELSQGRWRAADILSRQQHWWRWIGDQLHRRFKYLLIPFSSTYNWNVQCFTQTLSRWLSCTGNSAIAYNVLGLHTFHGPNWILTSSLCHMGLKQQQLIFLLSITFSLGLSIHCFLSTSDLLLV